MSLFAKAVSQLTKRETKTTNDWRALVTDLATGGKQPTLEAIEAAAPDNLRGREALAALAEDVNKMKTVHDAEHRAASKERELSALDLRKLKTQRETAALKLQEAEKALARYHSLAVTAGYANGDAERLRRNIPRCFPELQTPEPVAAAAPQWDNDTAWLPE